MEEGMYRLLWSLKIGRPFNKTDAVLKGSSLRLFWVFSFFNDFFTDGGTIVTKIEECWTKRLRSISKILFLRSDFRDFLMSKFVDILYFCKVDCDYFNSSTAPEPDYDWSWVWLTVTFAELRGQLACHFQAWDTSETFISGFFFVSRFWMIFVVEFLAHSSSLFVTGSVTDRWPGSLWIN